MLLGRQWQAALDDTRTYINDATDQLTTAAGSGEYTGE